MRYLLILLMAFIAGGCSSSTSQETSDVRPVTKVLYFDAGSFSPSQGMLSTLMDVIAGCPETLHLKRVDIHTHPELTSAHQITALPTLIVLQDGEETGRLVGRTSHPELDLFFHRTLLL